MKKFFGILTEIGQAKQANAMALGKTLRITEIEVGDGGGGENAPVPTPDPKQKNLISSRRRAPINQLRVDPNNANYMIAEQIIPENEGGWWIREMGARDEGGDLVAVSNCAPTYKPLLAEGSGRQQVARMIFMVAGADVFELRIDPAVVLATRQYVDEAASLLLGKQGTAEAAKKLQTACLISLTGAVSGSAKFDGSSNIEIETVDGGANIWVPYRAAVPLKKEGDIIMVKNLGELHWVETPFFTGYRSPLVGRVELDTTAAPRPWQIDAVGTVLNKSDYPGLWANAQENGLVVTAASWTPRVLRYADLSTTQFRAPDLRDMFFRGGGEPIRILARFGRWEHWN